MINIPYTKQYNEDGTLIVQRVIDDNNKNSYYPSNIFPNRRQRKQLLKKK